jgi:hypothetical protein
MKKYLLGIFAVVLAISFSAFSPAAKQDNLVPMYWYDLDGNSLGFGIHPNNGCEQEGVGCAKGFIVEPADPLTEEEDDTRRVNE